LQYSGIGRFVDWGFVTGVSGGLAATIFRIGQKLLKNVGSRSAAS